eukprot:scaffold3540_cov379-Prasinococcus_capsulatus_cf.AAC.12
MELGSKSSILLGAARKMFQYTWGGIGGLDLDIAKPEFVRQCLKEAGVSEADADRYVRMTGTRAVKEHLKLSVKEARSHGQNCTRSTHWQRLPRCETVALRWLGGPCRCARRPHDRRDQCIAARREGSLLWQRPLRANGVHDGQEVARADPT